MSDQEFRPKERLRNLVVNASSWTFMEYGISQGLRFVTNLVLTRLLIPDVFGIMQLVVVFISGLEMFCDLGMNVNIIQNKRGEELSFRRSAWTLQIIRGFILWIASCFIAWPVSKIYDAEILMRVIPIAGLGAVIGAFTSTNLPLYQRRLQLRNLAILNISSQGVKIIATIVLALMWHNVWALVIASLTENLFRTVISHYTFRDTPMKFCWEKESIREIVHFGKWVFASSILVFIVSRVDRLIFGLYLSKKELGVYAIAIALAQAFIPILRKLCSDVLIPLYARLHQLPRDVLRKHLVKVRSTIMLGLIIPSYVMMLWGDKIINFLYPIDYQEAGWMLQILAFGTGISCITNTIGPILLAVGNSFRLTMFLLYRAVVQTVLIVCGVHYWGVQGLFIGLVVTEFFAYPVLILCVRKYHVWLPSVDFLGFGLSLLVLLKVNIF